MQIVAPDTHAVLPNTFERQPFSDSLLDLTVDGKRHYHHSARPFVAHHRAFLECLSEHPTVRLLASGPPGFAHEAGVYWQESDEVWFTSELVRTGKRDVDGFDDCVVQIRKVRLSDGRVTLVDVSGVRSGNGACAWQGGLLFCDQGQGKHLPSRLVLVDPARPETAKVILNNYHGRPFSSLNDVIILAGAEGTQDTIWFTDPPYGHEQGFRPRPSLPPQVYCFEPVTGEVRAVADGFDHPNGICFSPCGTVCYITDTSHIHGTGTLDAALQSTM